MSDGDSRMSRRTLLYGLTTAGIGAGTGVTSAMLSDTESFAGNLLSGGEVDIETCWDKDGSGCSPDDGDLQIDIGPVSEEGDAGSGLIRIELPEDDGNNPAWVCLRTSCPEDDSGLEEKLDATVWRDENCDVKKDGNEKELASGTLGEVLKTLRGGVLIDGDLSTSDPDPLEPGDKACIGFKWKLSEDLDKDDSVDIDFEFSATQSRNTIPQDVCSDQTCGDRKGISFVALCGPDLTESGTNVETPTDTNGDPITNDEGEPIEITWSADNPVDSVVIKTGGGSDALYNFDGGGETSGRRRVDTTTADPDPKDNQGPSNPCLGDNGVKYEYENGVWGFTQIGGGGNNGKGNNSKGNNGNGNQ